MRKSEMFTRHRKPQIPGTHKKPLFSDLKLSDNVKLGLYENGFIHASHMQRRAVPLGCSSTGRNNR